MSLKGSKNPIKKQNNKNLPVGELHLLPDSIADKAGIGPERDRVVFDEEHGLFQYKSEKAAKKAVWKSKPIHKKIGLTLKAATIDPLISTGKALGEAGIFFASHVKENAVAIAGLSLGGYGSLEYYYNKPLGIGMMIVGMGMVVGQDIYKKRRNRN